MIGIVRSCKITVRYDGADLAGHQMDIEDLAPALMGLAELYTIANRKFNGDKSSVRVLVATDVEHQCFQFDIEVVQGRWEQAKGLLNDSGVASAKELGKWLGFIGGGGASAAGLLKLLTWLVQKKLKFSQLRVDLDAQGSNVVVTGDNNRITVNSQSHALLDERSVRKALKPVLGPAAKEGYSSLEFESRGNVGKNLQQRSRRRAQANSGIH